MKRLVILVIVMLVMVALAVIGCSNKGLISPSPDAGEETVSSRVTCHTDKDTLKEVASPEPEEVSSEETSGEG